MALIVLTIDGVLSDAPTDNLLTAESSNLGKVLYDIVRGNERVILLADDHDKDRVKAWLARERFTRYGDVHCQPRDSEGLPWEWRVKHVKDMLSVGHHVSFFIDSEPDAIRGILDLGVPALQVVASQGPPGGIHSSESPYRPWYDLVETVERRSLLQTTDTE
jgi:hypothetical protein